MLLEELARSEFGKNVNWTEPGVHSDRSTSTKALEDKEKFELFSTP